MKKTFTNPNHVEVIFTGDGIVFSGEKQKEQIYFPYGSIDLIKMSLLGILQVQSHARICTFAVERTDRAEMKKMISYALQALKTAPAAAVQILHNDCDDPAVSTEEQLKQLKSRFIQGLISKEEYDLRKKLLKEEA